MIKCEKIRNCFNCSVTASYILDGWKSVVSSISHFVLVYIWLHLYLTSYTPLFLHRSILFKKIQILFSYKSNASPFSSLAEWARIWLAILIRIIEAQLTFDLPWYPPLFNILPCGVNHARTHSAGSKLLKLSLSSSGSFCDWNCYVRARSSSLNNNNSY